MTDTERLKANEREELDRILASVFLPTFTEREREIARLAARAALSEVERHAALPTRQGNFYGNRLEAKVEDGAVVIRIGIQTLAHAVTYSAWASPYDEASGDYVRSFAITDAPQFASDVVHEMLREREDGSTPLSDFLDKMTEAAVNDGSLGLHEDEHRIKHGEKSPLETW